MKNFFILGATVFLFQCCSTNNKQDSSVSIKNEKEVDSFFPVTSFIKGQIFIIDSLPVTPLQITTINGEKDSAWLTKNELKAQLQSFLNPLINETNLKEFFKETRFQDQTLNAVTFTYDPIHTIPDSIPLRHWDVYIEPETGKVTKVYLVKFVKEQNQSHTLQLTWQTDKQAKITTILNKQDGSVELLKEVVFIWDFR